MPKTKTPAVTPEPVAVVPVSAKAPSRSCGSLTIGLGLLSIPVKVYAGTEDNGIKRSEYIKIVTGTGTEIVESYAKVGRRPYFTDETGADQIIEYRDITKRYDADGTLIDLSDAEIAAAVGRLNGEAKILAFQSTAILNSGAYLIDSLMQVRPAKRGTSPDPVTQRAFSLLMTAMKEKDVFGLVQYVLNGKIRYAALTSIGRLYGLRYSNEVREELPLQQIEVTEPEVAAASFLIDCSMVAVPMDLTDEGSAAVAVYAAKKAALDEGGRTIAGKAADTMPDPADKAPTAFSALMESLRASVEAAARDKAVTA